MRILLTRFKADTSFLHLALLTSTSSYPKIAFIEKRDGVSATKLAALLAQVEEVNDENKAKIKESLDFISSLNLTLDTSEEDARQLYSQVKKHIDFYKLVDERANELVAEYAASYEDEDSIEKLRADIHAKTEKIALEYLNKPESIKDEMCKKISDEILPNMKKVIKHDEQKLNNQIKLNDLKNKLTDCFRLKEVLDFAQLRFMHDVDRVKTILNTKKNIREKIVQELDMEDLISPDTDYYINLFHEDPTAIEILIKGFESRKNNLTGFVSEKMKDLEAENKKKAQKIKEKVKD